MIRRWQLDIQVQHDLDVPIARTTDIVLGEDGTLWYQGLWIPEESYLRWDGNPSDRCPRSDAIGRVVKRDNDVFLINVQRPINEAFVLPMLRGAGWDADRLVDPINLDDFPAVLKRELAIGIEIEDTVVPTEYQVAANGHYRVQNDAGYLVSAKSVHCRPVRFTTGQPFPFSHAEFSVHAIGAYVQPDATGWQITLPSSVATVGFYPTKPEHLEAFGSEVSTSLAYTRANLLLVP